MSKKLSARIATVLATATMALSMQTALNAAAAPPKRPIYTNPETGEVMRPICDITQNDIVYSLYEGNVAHVKSGKDASGTVQIPNAIYADGTYYVVTAIEYEAFKDNANITSVDMQYASGITGIADSAFWNCSNLVTVALPKNMEIHDNFNTVFYNCDSLREFTSRYPNHYNVIDGVIYNEDNTEIIKYPSAKTGETFTLNDGISVRFNAFQNLKYLKNIIVPEQITESNATEVLNRCSNIISGIQGTSFTVNGIDPFVYSEDDSEEPQIVPVFQDGIYETFQNYTNISDYYAKRYAAYIAKKYVDMENDNEMVRALKLHNWLCNHVQYDPVVKKILDNNEVYTGDEKNHCDASAFLHYEKASDEYPEAGFYTVCDGYSRAYSLLLNAAGVCCEAVDGDPNGGKYGHAWNVVKLYAYDNDPTNDRCYYVDTTWDDKDQGWKYDFFMCSTNPDDFDHSKDFINWRIYTKHSNGQLTEIPYKTYSIKRLGDINEDGFVTGADLKVLEDYMNGSYLTDVQKANADLNFDGVIENTDVDILSEYVYSRIGDVNGDGIVNEADHLSLNNYIEIGIHRMAKYMKIAADVNMDGNIDEADLDAIGSMYGQTRENDRTLIRQSFFERCLDKLLQSFPEELRK
ncbi:MAG: leucine-rich repeat protein [Ruminococcus sp.]|uniref:dockerin type I domain-containing protein n=1 Tax=Ruminococcus sp. TaxID=41978 RepID=UPI0025D1B5A8|nr:dockerin type I domain-containing protein [Ruminococcus sp.]MCR5600632.1 leucine-rich repeat protein [Ruminococcus sp.]